MKKILIVTCFVVLTIALNVVSAHAYTVLKTTVGNVDCAVYITANGSIAGNTVAFSCDIVAQGATTTYATLDFPANPAGKTDSGKALKITGGTNVVGARIVIATENDILFTNVNQDPREKDINGNSVIDVTEYSGSDGSGLIGSANQGYVAALYWGISTTPNSNTDYAFNYTAGSTNWSWIVDKWHNKTYVPSDDGISPKAAYTGLDQAVMYKLGAGVGAAEANPATEGTGTYKYLYPQYWDQDLYDLPSGNTSRKVYTIGTDVVGEALYKNIGTIAYNIQVGSVIGGVDYSGYYICQVPKWNAAPPNNYTIVKLKKVSGTPDEFMYVPIGGDFSGLPAQSYSTSKLYVAMVQD